MYQVVWFILFAIGYAYIMMNFIKTYNWLENTLQQHYIASSTYSPLSKNFLNFNQVIFTWKYYLNENDFSWKEEAIYIRLIDWNIDTSNLDDYNTIKEIRKNLTGFCLRYQTLEPNNFTCRNQN